MQAKERLLADLVDMDSPEAVLDEVLFIMTLVAPQLDLSRLTNAFSFVVSLYRGHWPGERACNTHFHDLRHITDTFLAMARLLHGAILNGRVIGPQQIFTGLVAALAHDAGYIQDCSDAKGTGAKYTDVHVDRSMAFVAQYGRRFGLTTEEIPICQLMIHCTDLKVDVAEVDFPSPKAGLLAKLLACADLIGQMADRIYLEKLFYLYREFEEGRTSPYKDEMDLLSQTLDFFPAMAERIRDQLDACDELALAHFKVRWDIGENLYQVAIRRQERYLRHILSHPEVDPSRFLRRKNLVRRYFQSCRIKAASKA